MAQEGLCIEKDWGKCPYPSTDNDDGHLCGKCFARYLVEKLGYPQVEKIQLEALPPDFEAVKVKLIVYDNKPAVKFADGDIIFQSDTLADFLMHLSILMPDCELPDEFYIRLTKSARSRRR